VFLTGNVLCAFAPNYGVLVVARILIALVSGTLVAIAMTYAPDVTAERYRTKFIRGGCAGWHVGCEHVRLALGVPFGERAYDGTYCAHGDGAAAQQPYCEDWFSAAIPPVFRSSYSAALLSAYCVRMSSADAMTVWLGAMRTPCAIFAGVMVSSMLVGMTIRETQLFRFFKQR